jgi:hypothetical protein
MSAVLARIALRYAAAALITRGLLAPEDGAMLTDDPDLQMLAGAGLATLAEGWRIVAKRMGWAT